MPTGTRTLTTPTSSGTHATPHRWAAADWEEKKWRVAYWDGRLCVFSREEFMEPERFRDAEILFVEAPHLAPRPSRETSLAGGPAPSKAQPTTAEEWNRFDPGCEVREYCNFLTWKASKQCGNVLPREDDKDGLERPDKNKDAETILWHVTNSDEWNRCRVWRRPEDDTKRQASYVWRDEIRDDCNIRCNIERGNSPEYRGPDAMLCRERVQKPVGTENESLDEVFGWKRQGALRQKKDGTLYKTDVGKAPGQLKLAHPNKLIFAIYATQFDRDGRLRLDPDGRPIGIKALVDGVIGLAGRRYPNHVRATVMRSAKNVPAQVRRRGVIKLMQRMRDDFLRDVDTSDSHLERDTCHSAPVRTF